jgi:hypothetical protein
MAIYKSFDAREIGAASLSGCLAVILSFFFDALYVLESVELLPNESLPPDRSRTRPSIYKFSAEELMSRSAFAVHAANPNNRGPQAADN